MKWTLPLVANDDSFKLGPIGPVEPGITPARSHLEIAFDLTKRCLDDPFFTSQIKAGCGPGRTCWCWYVAWEGLLGGG